jgi:hypothetical protein
MKTRPGLAQWILLAAAGGAAFYGASQFGAPDAGDEPTESLVRDVSAHTGAAATAAMAAPSASIAAPPARPAIEVDAAADTFRSKSWLPPPPPPPPPSAAAPPAPPPKPVAPPLPFRFVGMLEQQSDKPTAFLAKGEALHVVHVGDVIDGAYRIESLSPAKVVVTYLPLKQEQTLGVDGGQP